MESRQARMNKYYDKDTEEKTNTKSRINKNKDLYKEVSHLDLKDFDLNSNARVIGNNTDNINLDEIKDILDKKYQERRHKKSFGDTEEIILPKIKLDETREYDLNSVLQKAKEAKKANYEEERLKKIRNTQYDILKSLNLLNKDSETQEINEYKKKTKESGSKKKEREITDLINTISSKEKDITNLDTTSKNEFNDTTDNKIDIDNSFDITLSKRKKQIDLNDKSKNEPADLDPLDILSDLRGDNEATKVMGMLTKDIEKESQKYKSNSAGDTLSIKPSNTNLKDGQKNSPPKKREIIPLEFTKTNEISLDEEPTKDKLYDSFIGKSTFSDRDFDDFDDLKKDMKITKIIIRILIIVIVIIFIIGIIFILNKHFNLGLF